MTAIGHRLPCTALLLCTCFGHVLAIHAQVQNFHNPQDLVRSMLDHERESHRDRYEYLLNERSERTGGHLWTERVVETSVGHVRLLLAEDGKPLSAAREQQEHARLKDIAAHPDEFARSEQAQKNDEDHTRQMLDVLPRAFLLENVKLQNGVWHIDFRPNPDYAPSGIEEHVLHGMTGWLAIDASDLRLVHIEGHLPENVAIGFGLLANIRSGSYFSTDRQLIEGHWRTVHILTDIRGKAALFKTVSRNSDLTRSEFHYLDPNITAVQAVALLEH